MHPSAVTLSGLGSTFREAAFGPPRAAPWVTVARIFITALLIGVGVDQVVSAIREWPLHDMDTYLAAAMRLRSGQSPYVHEVAYNAFWYAPWFAAVWIPFTFLPRVVVAVMWSALLLVATGLVSLRLARLGPSGLLLALLLGPSLFAVSAGGNVQSLILLPLLDWPARRGSAVWLGIVASLKVTPLLLVLVYIRRRQWHAALVAVGAAVLLLLPGVAMGLFWSGSSTDWGGSLASVSPVLYGLAVLGAAMASFAVRQRFAVTAAAVASVFALPRLFVYDSTLLAAGTASSQSRRRELPAREPLNGE
jgi:hypothetical protein